MTEMQIAKLVEMGAKRWTKGNKDRLYFSAWTLGLGYAPRTAKSNARCLMIDGEELTITKGNKLAAAKIYIDLTFNQQLSLIILINIPAFPYLLKLRKWKKRKKLLLRISVWN